MTVYECRLTTEALLRERRNLALAWATGHEEP